MKHWALALVVSLLALLGAPQASAQDAAKVTLTIRLASDSTRFHVGEIIPIELSFSTSELGAFICSSSDHDMLGRLGFEVFHVTPAARDPLEHYLPPLTSRERESEKILSFPTPPSPSRKTSTNTSRSINPATIPCISLPLASLPLNTRKIDFPSNQMFSNLKLSPRTRPGFSKLSPTL